VETNSKKVVGRAEWCGLLDLGVPMIKARVDSGAKTSSIHAFNIQRFKRDGESWVSFELHPLQGRRYPSLRCERPVIDKRVIKSSSGESESRYVVMTDLELGGEVWPIEVTLANRDSMGYRMLLGREAMMGRLMVDPGLTCTLGDHDMHELESFYRVSRPVTAGLRIALLASNEELYSNQRLLEAARERGHKATFVNISQCYMKLPMSLKRITAAANPSIPWMRSLHVFGRV
jgi:ribosomal protein S6--L-glutamate ligase